MIDWTDKDCAVTEHFTVGDCIMLHQWNRLATETDGLDDSMKSNLIASCEVWESVRELLGCAMKVHCMFRSPAYNKLIGAPQNDAHSKGKAIDFDCGTSMTIDEVHSKMESQLEVMGLRMERGTATWIHLDTCPVIHNRYFNP